MKIMRLMIVLGVSWTLAFAEDAKKQASTNQVPLKMLSAEEQTKLLANRLEGSLGDSFGAFANMFMVRSQMELGKCIGLKGKTGKLLQAELQSVFPDFYKPSLKELMDAIALQTSSTWSYRKEDQFVNSHVPEKTEFDHMVIFTFVPTEAATPRARPFSVNLAKDWKTLDHGHWLACIPPTFLVGMDIYEMGTYSASKKANEAALFAKVRQEVALEWAQRVKKDAKAEDLKPVKVGGFDALHFDAMVPSQDDKDIRWRHWVFMVDNACYFIVSTIFPEMEEQLFPDVQTMLGSFKAEKH